MTRLIAATIGNIRSFAPIGVHPNDFGLLADLIIRYKLHWLVDYGYYNTKFEELPNPTIDGKYQAIDAFWFKDPMVAILLKIGLRTNTNMSGVPLHGIYDGPEWTFQSLPGELESNLHNRGFDYLHNPVKRKY